ncbi:MAG: serine/threonine-protein kinase [Acidobacteriota bacterium]
MAGRPGGRALAVLDAVLDAEAADRQQVLARECGDDDDLRRQVEAMLELEDEEADFLASPIRGVDRKEGEPRPAPTLEAGTRLGPWEIDSLIGRGGMGTVYRASRRRDYQADVAIKVLGHRGLLGSAWRRFEQERQILARLEHPAIARLIDGGTFESAAGDETSYLVMELVDGVALDEYCRRQALGVRKRLQLFRQICAAVSYAHRNLIVHRDLKPSNILVTRGGQAKLLDFGIAKLVGESSDLSLTSFGSPMTPQYASPEQIKGRPITTASDVYSLGVVLYQLLTGALPVGLEDSTPAEVARKICEEEPSRPSAVLRQHSALEGSRLRGDLDAIVMKALRKEPEERFVSVEALAEDIDRYLRGLPVEARRGNLPYVIGKFVRRHRWPLAAASLAAAALGGFTVREVQRLDFEAHRSEQLERVLEELILTADPDTGPLDAAKLLGKASEQIEALEVEPRLRGELLDSLGFMHRKVGDLDKARELATLSLEAWREENPGDDPDFALRLNNVGALMAESNAYEEAEAYFREALEMRRRMGHDESPEMTTNRANLGVALMNQGRWDDAEEELRQVLKARRHASALPPLDGQDRRTKALRVASALRTLGALNHARGHFEDAVPLLEEAVALRRAHLGDEHSAVASALDLLGRVRFAAGDRDRAELLYRQAIDLRRRVLGDGHASLAWSELNLGQLLLAEGDLPAARLLIVRASTHLANSQPAGHWRIARAQSLLGELFFAEGNAVKARICLQQGLDGLRAARREDSTFVREAADALGRLESDGAGRAQESSALLQGPSLLANPSTPVPRSAPERDRLERQLPAAGLAAETHEIEAGAQGEGLLELTAAVHSGQAMPPIIDQ